MHERIRERRSGIREARRRRRLRRVRAVALTVALGAMAALLSRTPLFSITEVTVTGVSGDREATVREAADVTTGDNLVLTDVGAVAARVEALPWVERAATARRPPSHLHVHVVPREPVAVLAAGPGSADPGDGGSDGRLLDAEGVVVGEGDDPLLPAIDATTTPPVGRTVTDPAVRAALVTHATLPDRLRARVVRYDARDPADLRIVVLAPTDATTGGTTALGATAEATADAATGVGTGQGDGTAVVRFGGPELVDDKVRALDLLLRYAERESVDLTDALAGATVDVRAPDRPVLRPAASASTGGT